MPLRPVALLAKLPIDNMGTIGPAIVRNYTALVAEQQLAAILWH